MSDLTDEQLREKVAQLQPDLWLHSSLTELLALRAECAKLEAARAVFRRYEEMYTGRPEAYLIRNIAEDVMAQPAESGAMADGWTYDKSIESWISEAGAQPAEAADEALGNGEGIEAALTAALPFLAPQPSGSELAAKDAQIAELRAEFNEVNSQLTEAAGMAFRYKALLNDALWWLRKHNRHADLRARIEREFAPRAALEMSGGVREREGADPAEAMRAACEAIARKRMSDKLLAGEELWAECADEIADAIAALKGNGEGR